MSICCAFSFRLFIFPGLRVGVSGDDVAPLEDSTRPLYFPSGDDFAHFGFYLFVAGCGFMPCLPALIQGSGGQALAGPTAWQDCRNMERCCHTVQEGPHSRASYISWNLFVTVFCARVVQGLKDPEISLASGRNLPVFLPPLTAALSLLRFWFRLLSHPLCVRMSTRMSLLYV